MKKIIRDYLACICVLAVLITLCAPIHSFAEPDFNNNMKPGSSYTVPSTASNSMIQRIRETDNGNTITYPDSSSYYSYPQQMYIDSADGNSVRVFKVPKWDKNKQVGYAMHGTRVSGLARQDGYVCILFWNHKNEYKSAWVKEDSVSSYYPGKSYTVGWTNKLNNYVGDIPVSWSSSKFLKQGQKYSVLSKKVRNCTSFTLDYQVYDRNGASIRDITGPRTIYINDGSGWEEVGSFDYSEITAVHVTVYLNNPKDILAIATDAHSAKPNTPYFRQCALDFYTS